MSAVLPDATLERDGPEGTVLAARGDWTVSRARAIDARVAALSGPGDVRVILRLDGLYRLAGTRGRLEIQGGSEAQRRILEVVERVGCHPQPNPTPRGGLVGLIETIGAASLDVAVDARRQVAFLGAILVRLVRLLAHPGALRLNAVVSHVERTGLDAVPIVFLLSFLIGTVMAYQGSTQLERFGAQIFTVDLIGISVLRELGVVLTAIIVAGRSGSAFTAEIGSMVVNEEVDAARTIGIEPIDALVLPRLLALLITLPLLTFIADLAGLLGGGLVVIGALDITAAQYLDRLLQAVTLQTFWVGLVKAPVFAFLIAMVGCYHGLMVERSAQSVGLMTTRAVVVGIFLVIVADAAFSVVFSELGL
jgi:phospholipid/cholesterol/gamma-HCH transport system permease protein